MLLQVVFCQQTIVKQVEGRSCEERNQGNESLRALITRNQEGKKPRSNAGQYVPAGQHFAPRGRRGGFNRGGGPVVAEAGPFLEPKKENVARIVADCRATNQHVATPPRVPLPSLKQLTSIFKVPSLQVSR
jgi:hypothetical protein